MNKVVTINLNGNAYQLDEPGFASLSAYIAQAKARLTDNPDREEIMADLEQAIADKLRRFLSAHKSVVTAEEVGTVIAEMGPVDGGSEAAAGTTENATPGPKRLYRIEEGKWIGGVATGLAAYLNVGVHLIRLLMIILTLMTSGGFIFGYILAWIFIPPALTQEEQAKAHGEPFNTEELIARAKAEYANLNGRRSAWKKMKRAERKSYERAYWQSYAGQWGHRRRSSIGQLIGLTVFSFLAWLGYHQVPVIHDFLVDVWALVQRISDSFAQVIVSSEK